MSFDEFLKMKDQAEQLRILVKKNAWRTKAFQPDYNYKKYFREQIAADGVRLAELLNPIPESL